MLLINIFKPIIYIFASKKLLKFNLWFYKIKVGLNPSINKTKEFILNSNSEEIFSY